MTEEQNELLVAMPTEEEIKQAIFDLNGESASGPYGFTEQFYQSCWNIIKEDLCNMVKAFFVGQELPRYITHTNLVLIPKGEQVTNFGDVRPISLSNFSNKIFSKVIQGRLDKVLPSLISPNQTGFLKGKSIFENVLLAQEIVKAIRIRTKSANVLLKMDMTKSYDRISWLYLTKVLR